MHLARQSHELTFPSTISKHTEATSECLAISIEEHTVSIGGIDQASVVAEAPLRPVTFTEGGKATSHLSFSG
ncbi:hypothetical protein D3C80_1821920 [compost metagenome]